MFIKLQGSPSSSSVLKIKCLGFFFQCFNWEGFELGFWLFFTSQVISSSTCIQGMRLWLYLHQRVFSKALHFVLRSSFVYQEVHMLLKLHEAILGSCTRKEEHEYHRRISPIASFNLMQAPSKFIHGHSIPFKITIKVLYSSNFHPRFLFNFVWSTS